jgi:DNA polymerase I-like protein with 3'-5' exonuclease and polymerase domains
MIDPELALRIVREEPTMVLDTETSGLTLDSFICGWVITGKYHSIYIPVRHEAGGNIPNAERFETALAAAFLERSRLGYRTVGHNLGFDLRIAARHGVYPGSPLEDTMLNESLINDLTVGYSLDECSRRHGVTVKLGADLYAEIARRFGGIPDKKQMGKFWKMPGDDKLVVDYATGDGISTMELWAKQQDVLDRDGLRRVHQLECDLLPYLARMHSRGLKVDPDYSARVQVDIEESIKTAMAPFQRGFNARSPLEVEKLYRANGYQDRDFTKTATGKVSFTEKWLGTNKIGNAILGVRRLEKARDSFIAPLVDTHNHGGRVHPILNQSKSDDYGVAGARLSCTEPNMQAFPKRNIDVGRVVRRLIVPDGGMLIEEADAKQQEPRLFTHFSEEPALVEGYCNGTMDMHDLAAKILRLDREVAKRLGMGMLTMMSIPTLARHMECDEDEAKVMHRAFLSEAFPQIGVFQNTVVSKWREQKVVKTILGRRAYLDDPRFAYRGVSRVIQNNGGDHIKLCMLRANQYEDAHPDRIQILLSIHDSLVWQRDPAHSSTELVKIIENVANEMELIVPIPFGLGSGKDWARASYGEKLDKYTD